MSWRVVTATVCGCLSPVAEPDFTAALRVTRHIDIEDVRLAFTYFGQPDTADVLEEFHTEFLANVVSCDEGRLEIETGYRLARHHPEGSSTSPSEADPSPTTDGDDLPPDAEEDAEVLGVAHYLVTYVYEEEPPAEDLEAFAYHNAILNTWPYWRQHVQTMAAAMGLKRLIVPVYKIPILPPDHKPET